jgi:predicted 2-oxoglutarate/Fe(II)-dependent dioxygenase YbiX
MPEAAQARDGVVMPAAWPAASCMQMAVHLPTLPSLASDRSVTYGPVRRGSAHWIVKRSLDPSLQAQIETFSGQVNAQFFGLEAGQVQCPLLFCRYQTGDFLNWHDDLGSANAATRKLAFSLQLSNPLAYDGGDLQFLNREPGNPLELRSQGTVVAFPAFIAHRVTTVIRGERLALVWWLEGQRFR